MAYINCEQDHIDNEIRYISMKTMQWTTHIYQSRKRKINTRTRLNTYLNECTIQWKNNLEIKEVKLLWDLKYIYLQKRNS